MSGRWYAPLRLDAMVAQHAAAGDNAFPDGLSAVDPKTGRTVKSPEALSGTHGTYTMYRLERRLFKASCDSCKAANTDMTTRFRRARGVKPRPKPLETTPDTAAADKATGGAVDKQRIAGTASRQRAQAKQAAGDVKPIRKNV